MKMKTTLDYALDYYHKSFSVIPVINKDKKPAIRSWELNKTTRADEKQIQQWFSNNGSNNNITLLLVAYLELLHLILMETQQKNTSIE
jgi:hypothetical protein